LSAMGEGREKPAIIPVTPFEAIYSACVPGDCRSQVSELCLKMMKWR
jgi:hypothetical protein